MKRDPRTIVRRSGLVAGVAAVGLSLAACSSGSNDAAAADATTTDTAGTSDTVVTDGSADGTGQPGQGGPAVFSRGVSGQVTEVDGSSITVEQVAQDGTITETVVETSDDTTVTEMVPATLDDLAVGDEVVVAGGTDGTAATTISEGGAMFGGGPVGGRPPVGATPPANGSFPDGSTPPPDFATDGPTSQGVPGGPGPGGPGGMATFGTITEIGDGTITIETVDGESVVVTVDETTAVTKSQERGVSDIAEGDTIRVMSPPTDGAADASDHTAAVVAGTIVIQPAS